MCARFDPVTRPDRFKEVFGTALPLKPDLSGFKGVTGASGPEVFPMQWAPIIRATPEGLITGDAAPPDAEVPHHEALWACFGLVPSWAKDTSIARHTYNARSETVATKPSFRSAWAKHQHCVVPAEAFTEPLYEAGKANPTRIACADGLPMGIAGLWSSWKDPSEAGSPTMHSFTMLTINADEHALMNRFHKPGDEKRMVVILPRGSWKAWLFAKPNRMSTAGREQMIRRYPAERLALQTS